MVVVDQAEINLEQVLQEIRLMRAESLAQYQKILTLEALLAGVEAQTQVQIDNTIHRAIVTEIKGAKRDRRLVLSLITLLTLTIGGIQFSAKVENGDLQWAVESASETVYIKVLEILGIGGVISAGAFSAAAVRGSLQSSKETSQASKTLDPTNDP